MEIKAEDIRNIPPELCEICTQAGVCDLLARKKAYKQAFLREMEGYKNLLGVTYEPEEKKETEEKRSKAVIERSDFVANLQLESYRRKCANWKEL